MKKISRLRKMRENAAFTLPEVLIAVMILAIALVGMMRLFIYCSSLAKTSGNITLAMAEAQDKLEEIRNHPYATIAVDYAPGGTPGDTFALAQVTGTGVIYIDNSTPNRLEIQIVVSWQDDKGRVIGEDLDLDGDLDGGEDTNGNGQLDSMTTLVTLLTKR